MVERMAFRRVLLTAVLGCAMAQTCSQTHGAIIGSGSVNQTTAKSAEDCCSACFAFGYGCLAYTGYPYRERAV